MFIPKTCKNCFNQLTLYMKNVSVPYVRCMLRHFSLGQSSNTKDATSKSKFLAIVRWNTENKQLYGPLLKSQQDSKLQGKLENEELENISESNKTVDENLKGQNTISETNVETKTTKDGSLLEESKIYKDAALQFLLQQCVYHNPMSDNFFYKQFVETLGLKSLPSVSNILSKTQSLHNRLLLQRWKVKMIKELGEAGFEIYMQKIKQTGINFHTLVQDYLAGASEDEIQMKEENIGHWKSLQSVFPLVNNIQFLETPLFHSTLLYKGICDCVAEYRGKLCVIEWKTSKKQKPLLSDTFDNPVQVAAYAGAFNSSHDIQVKSALVVVAYPGGHPAHVHFIDEKLCEYYWQQWLQRLDQYWQQMTESN